MNFILKKHLKFVNDMVTSLKIDSNPFTCLPSVLFLSCMFLVLYIQFHQHTNYFTRWKSRLYKDVVFHWVYFYITRVWLVFVRFARFLTTTLDEYIEESSPKEEILMNQTLTHACVFMVTLTISLMPLLVLSAQQIYRRHIPNFLMWVGDDPWRRSEIGTSGHYLERPAQLPRPYRSNYPYAYRSKRSTSFDSEIFSSKESRNFRPCKSMMAVHVVKTIDDLAE
ncbi:hypothetical protein JTB14_000431 [Gonioctena quinquepunctata]|nr:hypothetical protein JTB14_000431 [Gonioctena quinquepunctata]